MISQNATPEPVFEEPTATEAPEVPELNVSVPKGMRPKKKATRKK